jgi:nucleotide-binding universal stress UspA family protein
MMLETKSGKILLGVGDDDVGGAVAYAVAEARRRRVGVHVLHAVPMVRVGLEPTAMVLEGETLCAEGGRILAEIARRLEHELEELPVSTELHHGPAVSALVCESRYAGLVVLQRRELSSLRRIATLSVTNAVAGRAQAPVVVVPCDWRPRPEDEHLVVAGIEGIETSAVVVRAALDEARVRQGRVRFVHAWHLPDAYDDLVFEGAAEQKHSNRLRRNLRLALSPILRQYDDVPVEVVVAHARPADLTVAAAGRAGLVVMGRHRSTRPWGSHLGSIVRAVLRESTSPVLVVDPSTHETLIRPTYSNTDMQTEATQ